jgi:hypothetical protein
MAIDPGNKAIILAVINRSIVKKAVGFMGARIALLLLLQLIPVDVFTLRLPRQSSILAAAVRVKRGQVIRLSYRHSVELMRVEGRFKIGPGPSLLLQETRTKSVGTGLPNTYPDRTRREGDWLVVDENMREVGGFRFFLSPINQTRITTAGKPIDLRSLKDGSILLMNVERVNLLRWMLWRAASVPWFFEYEPQ